MSGAADREVGGAFLIVIVPAQAVNLISIYCPKYRLRLAPC